MASPADMARLATLKRYEDFDRLFLTLMIAHHDGALKMVDALVKQDGSAYDPVLFQFTSDVKTEQKAEINRMTVLLGTLATDPRVALKASFRTPHRRRATWRWSRSLPRPTGFFDPTNAADVPPPKAKKKKRGEDIKPAARDGQSNEGTEWSERSPLLSFAQTDMAFSGDVMVAGNYHGFNIYRLPDAKAPTLLSSVVCPGGQGDVSIVGDLLIMSVEQTRGRVDCGRKGREGGREQPSASVACASSTSPTSRALARSARCRPAAGRTRIRWCSRTRTASWSTTPAPPASARKRSWRAASATCRATTAPRSSESTSSKSPRPTRRRHASPPAPPSSRTKPADAWPGCGRAASTGKAQETSQTDQCHDITVFPTRKLAAGACSGNGIIFDISDPLNPKRLDAVTDKGFAYWHSATFNNDGTKVIFTDEWGGGSRPRCRSYDPRNWGADAIYDIVDNKLIYRGTYKLPAPQTDTRTASPTTARSCPCRAATSSCRPGIRAASR